MVAAGAGPELERGDRQTEEPGWDRSHVLWIRHCHQHGPKEGTTGEQRPWEWRVSPKLSFCIGVVVTGR